MKKHLTFLAILTASMLLMFVCGVYFLNSQMNQPINVKAGQNLFTVPKGSGLGQVLNSLAEKQILQVSPLVLRIYARFTRSEGHVKAGEYSLSESVSHKELLGLLRSGKVIQYQITFPEGIRCNEWSMKIKTVLDSYERVDKNEIDSDCENLMGYLGKPGLKAEGQFYPDTYNYTKDDTSVDIFRRAHSRMESVINEAWTSRHEKLPFKTPYDALILASIVEKETGAEEDRGKIASVFVNRLRKAMKLQSDPTIIYGIEDFDGNLRRRHIREETPFNTYVIKGLPPTPICNPGKASILAVLNPPETEYLYFVAKGDGRSYFSKSLEEHNKAVRQFQLINRAKNYKSVPDNE